MLVLHLLSLIPSDLKAVDVAFASLSLFLALRFFFAPRLPLVKAKTVAAMICAVIAITLGSKAWHSLARAFALDDSA